MQLSVRSLPARSRPSVHFGRKQLQVVPRYQLERLQFGKAPVRKLAVTLAATVAAAGELDPGTGLPDLRELTKDDFQSCLDEAGSKLVIVDFFTDWCGPCKVMYPTLQQMAVDQTDISIVKLNCNKYNKDLGKELGVKVAPTFQLYKNGKKVGEMTGAKVDQLQALIDQNK